MNAFFHRSGLKGWGRCLRKESASELVGKASLSMQFGVNKESVCHMEGLVFLEGTQPLWSFGVSQVFFFFCLFSLPL